MERVIARKTNTNVRWKKLTIFAMLAVLFLIVLIKFLTVQYYLSNYLIATYSLLVSFYAFIRFGLSYLYAPDDAKFDYSYLPTVTIAIPAKNEEGAIFQTIVQTAKSDYPAELLRIILVNDGSTDNTLSEMRRAKAEVAKYGIAATVVNWKKNRGKRAAMAEAVNRSQSEIILFVDSDSYIDSSAIRELVKYFPLDEKIGGVTAHTLVSNSSQRLLPRLQALHYFISYKVYKSTESLFGTVTCCPGCCSAYRLDYLRKNISEWSEEKFLGVRCTFGDDRSVTNYLLKHGYKTVFSPAAIAFTEVPEKLKHFLKQQLRWKKSWARESLLASKFFWKKNPIMALIFYLGLFLTYIAPLIVFRALVFYPLTLGVFAYSYLLGLLLTSVFLSLYYRIYTGADRWYVGLIYSFFYSFLLGWQLVYAVITIRNQSWGTR